MYTVSQKKRDAKLLPTISPNANQFSKKINLRLSGKFATNQCLDIPPCLELVATLPFEI